MNDFKQKFTNYLKGRNFSSTMLIAVVIALVVLVNVIIYTLSTVIPLYIHDDSKDDLSISSSSDILFDQYMKKGITVTVTFCSYEDVVKNHDTGTFVYQTAQKFAERYPDFIKLRFVNVITKLDSNGNSVDDELEVYLDGGNNMIDETSVIFSTPTGYHVVTDLYTDAGYVDFYTLDDNMNITSYNGEETFASSVLWALNENHGTAYFTVGHGETGNYTLYSILTAAGYNVKEINLRKNDIPEDAELLVISNPVADFERGSEGSSVITEYDRLVAYQRRGGNFLVNIDPLTKGLSVLWDFLDVYGVGYRRTESGEAMTVRESENAITADGYTLVATYADSALAVEMKSKITDRTGDDDGAVILKGVGAIEISKGAEPLLVSSPSSVCSAGGKTVDSEGSYVIAAHSTYEGSRLMFMSEGLITAADAVVSNGYSNKDFFYSLFEIYYGKGEMPYGCRSVLFENTVLENLTMGTIKIYTVILMAIPASLAVCGAVVLIRRKNR